MHRAMQARVEAGIRIPMTASEAITAMREARAAVARVSGGGAGSGASGSRLSVGSAGDAGVGTPMRHSADAAAGAAPSSAAASGAVSASASASSAGGGDFDGDDPVVQLLLDFQSVRLDTGGQPVQLYFALWRAHFNAAHGNAAGGGGDGSGGSRPARGDDSGPLRRGSRPPGDDGAVLDFPPGADDGAFLTEDYCVCLSASGDPEPVGLAGRVKTLLTNVARRDLDAGLMYLVVRAYRRGPLVDNGKAKKVGVRVAPVSGDAHEAVAVFAMRPVVRHAHRHSATAVP